MKKYFYASTGALALVVLISIYDSIVKSWSNHFTWILADALFGAGLIFIIIGFIFIILNKGGFTWIRYYRAKKKCKKENKPIPEYISFLDNNSQKEYGHFFIIALIMILISFVFSYI